MLHRENKSFMKRPTIVKLLLTQTSAVAEFCVTTSLSMTKFLSFGILLTQNHRQYFLSASWRIGSCQLTRPNSCTTRAKSKMSTLQLGTMSAMFQPATQFVSDLLKFCTTRAKSKMSTLPSGCCGG